MSPKNKSGMSSSVGISSAEISSVRKNERARAKELLAERREELRKMIYAALFLALAFLLPFLTANNQQIATVLSPMHIPAFLCGFVCGPGWGTAVGFCAPLLRSVTVGMPQPPMAVCMAFELAAYGFTAGLLRRLLPKKIPFLYISLVLSMILGRIVYCIVAAKVIGSDAAFFAAFIQQFAKTWIGILIHLAVVPPIVLAIEHYRERRP